MVTHQGCPQTPGGRIRALGFARMGARGRRRGPRTGDVSVSGLAGIILIKAALRRRAGASAPLASRAWARGAAVAARGPAMCQYQGSPV